MSSTNEATATARAAVARGVALLDSKVPGWWRVINLDQLDMSDCNDCMLGQLFGYDVERALGAKMFGLEVGIDPMNQLFDQTGYERGSVALCIKNKQVTIGCEHKLDINTYADLKCAWAEVIAERRTQEEVSSVE